MGRKKFRTPQIENNPTAFTQSRCQQPKHITICCCIEIAKALRHDDRNVERTGLWSIITNIYVYVAWAAT
jgi:hypothetical protein